MHWLPHALFHLNMSLFPSGALAGVLLLLSFKFAVAAAEGSSALLLAARSGSAFLVRAALSPLPPARDIHAAADAALASYNNALTSAWPPLAEALLPLGGHGFADVLDELLRAAPAVGSSPHCAAAAAASARNVRALALLLRGAGASRAARDCASAGGGTLLHAIAHSPAPGTARLLAFARRAGADAGVAAAAAAALGFEGGFPPWRGVGGALELAKATLEEAAGAPESAIVDAALAQLPSAERDAAFAVRDARGRTALDVACAAGRGSAMLEWLAARTPSWARGGGGAHNVSCAHAAAAAGAGAGTFEALARAGLDLRVRDASGATPCDVARARGKLSRGAASALAALGACERGGNGDGVGDVEGSPTVRHGEVTCAPPALPQSWDAAAHEAGGWAALGPDARAALGVRRNILSGAVAAVVGAAGERTSSAAPALLAQSCSPPELPFRAFQRNAASTAALLRDHAVLGFPFVVRALPRTGPPLLFSRGAFAEAFGNASVWSGEVPYAGEYGASAAHAPLSQFVHDHMGPAGAHAARGTTPRRLVFDAVALHGAAAPLEALFLRRRSALAPAVGAAAEAAVPLSQFIVGGGGAGSPMHFHSAALNVCLLGLRLWTLVPPSDAALAFAPVAEWWAAGAAERTPRLEVLQGPEDWVYVPPGWGHAVINLADSVALAWQAE